MSLIIQHDYTATKAMDIWLHTCSL